MIPSSLETEKYNREQDMKEFFFEFSFLNSVIIPSSLETAKYNQEQEMREIHLIKLFF